MIFQDVGEVVPGFHVLATARFPVYLFAARRPALFDSGLSFLADLYLEHARAVLGPRPAEFLFHTHVHYDHCGATGAFRRAYPGLAAAASPRAAEILRRPGALELMGRLTEESRGEAAGPAFEPFELDRVLADGEELDLGGEVVRVLATPGHTRDFLSYYLPGRKILIASEAGGCANWEGTIIPEFLADYEAYVASLERLRRLPVEVLCQGHRLVYTGAEARGFFERSLRDVEGYRRTVETLLEEEEGDVERVVARVRQAHWDPAPQPKQPLPAYLVNTRARVRLLASGRK